MAKGNLFLGTAAKSVGDVVMYRREGSQVSRVRVRKIANPKTDAQCEQRAFMAAVVKFYQPLANVLDRSWQGMSRAKSYAKFLKTNAAIVRAGGYYLPKGSGFFPLPLKLSNGTLAPLAFNVNYNRITLGIDDMPSAPQSVATIGNLSSIFVYGGAANGDVITIIAVDSVTDELKVPHAWQFIVNTESTDNLVTPNGLSITIYDDSEDGKELRIQGSWFGSAAALISARNNDGNWLRTTSFMDVDDQLLETVTSDEAKAAAIASYKGAAASDNPLVYLDGDELQ